jgi:hypothetical protein
MTCEIGSLDRFYPADAFFCARTTRDVMRWNVPDITRLAEYRLDATPAQLAGFAGALPFIAHEAAATPLALDFMAHCGLPGASHLRVYRTVQEAEALALDLMANGLKLAYNFGTLPGLETRCDQHLVASDLYAMLNAKQSLEGLVPRENLAPRMTLCAGDEKLPATCEFKPPVYVKLAGGHSTGGGAGVFHCSDEVNLDETLKQLSSRLAADDASSSRKIAHPWQAGVLAWAYWMTGWSGWARLARYSAHPLARSPTKLAAATIPDGVKDAFVADWQQGHVRRVSGALPVLTLVNAKTGRLWHSTSISVRIPAPVCCWRTSRSPADRSTAHVQFLSAS